MQSPADTTTVTTLDPIKPREKLPGLFIDTNFFDDPKVQVLIQDHGGEAGLYLLRIYLALAKAKDATLSIRLVRGLAFGVGVDQERAEILLQDMEELCLIYVIDGHVTHPRVVTDQEKIAERRARWRERQQRHRSDTDRTSGGHSSLSPPCLVSVTRDNSVTLKKKKNTEEEEEKEDLKENGRRERERSFAVPRPAQTLGVPGGGANSGDPNNPEDHLEPVTEEIKSHTLYVALGRRPMKRYPLLWIAPHELREVAEAYISAGVPPSELKRGFRRANERLKDRIAQGKDPNKASVVAWLTSFCLSETLEELKRENDLKRSEVYLANANGGGK